MAIDRQLTEGAKIGGHWIRRPEQSDFCLGSCPYAAVGRSKQFHLIVFLCPLRAPQVRRTVYRQELGSALHGERNHLTHPRRHRRHEGWRSGDPDSRYRRGRVRIGDVRIPSIAGPQGHDSRCCNLPDRNAASLPLTVGDGRNRGIKLALQGHRLGREVVEQGLVSCRNRDCLP